MKTSELRQLIREEVRKNLKEDARLTQKQVQQKVVDELAELLKTQTKTENSKNELFGLELIKSEYDKYSDGIVLYFADPKQNKTFSDNPDNSAYKVTISINSRWSSVNR